MIPLKKPEMQGAKFSRHETYLSYVAVTGKLKQRRRLGFFSGIINDFGVIKKERNTYGAIVRMQAREVVWKYRIAGGLTVPTI